MREDSTVCKFQDGKKIAKKIAKKATFYMHKKPITIWLTLEGRQSILSGIHRGKPEQFGQTQLGRG